MKHLLIGIALIASTTIALAVEAYRDPLVNPFVAEGWSGYGLRPPELSEAVRQSDVIFIGRTTQAEPGLYDDKLHGMPVSGTVVPESVLKGALAKGEMHLTWGPGAWESGTRHIFFIRDSKDGLKTVKAIWLYKDQDTICASPFSYSALPSGRQSTLDSIRILVSPTEVKLKGYAAALMADLEKPSGVLSNNAVWLACEVNRPECLSPLLYAITNHTEYFGDAVYAACRLDGEQGAKAALALVLAHPEERHVFGVIASAKNPQSTVVLEQFGDEHPEYRVSCAFAIREIARAKLPEIIRRWREDGEHSQIMHRFWRSKWDFSPLELSLDALLSKALSGEKVYRD